MRRLAAILSLILCLLPAVAAAEDLTDLQRQTAKTIAGRFALGGRYVIGVETSATPHQYCSEIPSDSPLLGSEVLQPYAGLKQSANARLLECSYPFPDGTRQGWAIVLAASADNIAARVVNACAEVVPKKVEACVKRLLSANWEDPWGSNNFIFPVTGFVREPCGDGENLIGFRHGVTIQYAGGPTSPEKMEYCIEKTQSVEEQRTIGLTYRTYDVFKVARIAALTRKAIPDWESLSNDPPAGAGPNPFQAYVVDNELQAIRTGKDRLMTLKAAARMGVKAP